HPLSENPVLQAILESGKTFVITDVPARPLSPGMKSVLEQTSTQTLAIIPMLSQNQPLGLVGLHLRDRSRSFTPEELTLGETICSQISTVVENARLLQDVQDRVALQDVIAQITDAALNSVSMPDLLHSIHKAVSRILPGRNFFVALQDAELDLLTFPYYVDQRGGTLPDQKTGRGLTGYVIQTGKPLLATPEVRAELFNQGKIADGGEHCIDWLGVPLRASNAVRGAMVIQSYEYEVRFTEKEKEILIALGNQAAGAIERLQARSALAKSESDLRALFASMEDVVLVVDRNARYLRIAPTNPGRLVRPANELLGHLMEEFVPAETAVRFKEAIAQTLHTGQTVQVEYELPINNQPFWFLASLSKMDAETVFWVARDITSRRQAEQEISKFKLGIENSGDAVFMTDKDGTITYVNSSFEKIYGYKAEEAIGKTPRILKSGLNPSEQDENFWNTLLSGEAITGEIVNRTRDGRFIPIAATTSPIVDEHGVIQGFLAVHHDITDTKQAEEALQRRNTYLAASADISRLVTSTLDLQTIFSRTVNLVSERFGYYHAAIFITDETHSFARLEEATGEPGAVMKAQAHRLAIGSKSIVGEVTQTASVAVVNDTLQNPLHKFNPLLPDTRSEAAIPLRVSDRIIGALDIQSQKPDAFSVDDIAVLQTLADQVAVAIDNARSYELSIQAVKEMREVDRLKSQFLANMSHELRTPL
ncbi:MAG TPA: GAF domain-containing protein, partial [Anaerolineales bacterium]